MKEFYYYIPKYAEPWYSYALIQLLLMKIVPVLAVLIMNVLMIWRLNNLKIRKRYTKSRIAAERRKRPGDL